MKVIGIIQPGYLPWLGFFDQMRRSSVFVIYDDVQFDKHGWRNRNRIKTPNGVQWVTVPVLHKNLGKQLIKDVAVNYTENWVEKHVKTITQSYNKAKFFDMYWERIEQCLRKEHKFLLDLNLELIELLKVFLGIGTPLVLSSSLGISGNRTDRLVNIIQNLGGTHFIEGDLGKSYIHEIDFSYHGITVNYQGYKHPTYSQIYGDFVPYLSIVDLLFNQGPKSLQILGS